MAWGHQDFARYTTADRCDRAVANVAFEMERTHARDTLSEDPAQDTLPAPVRAVARACRAQLRGPVSAERDPARLWSWFRLALALPDPAEAIQVMTQLLAVSPTPAERADIFRQAIVLALAAHPPQRAMARAFQRQLAALGSAAAVARVEAALAFLAYWQRGDEPESLRVEAQAARALVRALPPAGRDEVSAPWAPYAALFWLAEEAQELAQAQAIVDSGRAEVGAWHDGSGVAWFNDAAGLLRVQATMYGKATRPLAGRYWFHDGGQPRPRPGVVSLLVHVDHTCGRVCFPLYTLLKQLTARYGSRLELTLLTATRGYAAGTGPLAPAAEAQAAAQYFGAFVHLDAAVLVDETPQTKAPDGHIVRGTTPLGQMFNGWRLVNAVLIDRAGTLQWVGQLESPADQRRVAAAIERALAPARAPGA